MIEVELNEYVAGSDDNSLIYVDKEDVWVIVYYALRQLYQSRESDSSKWLLNYLQIRWGHIKDVCEWSVRKTKTIKLELHLD